MWAGFSEICRQRTNYEKEKIMRRQSLDKTKFMKEKLFSIFMTITMVCATIYIFFVGNIANALTITATKVCGGMSPGWPSSAFDGEYPFFIAGEANSCRVYKGFVFFDISGYESYLANADSVILGFNLQCTYTADQEELFPINLDFLGMASNTNVDENLWLAQGIESYANILNKDSALGPHTTDVTSISHHDFTGSYLVFRFSPQNYLQDWKNRYYEFSQQLSDTNLIVTSAGSLQFTLGNQTIGVGQSATADLVYTGPNFKGCEISITYGSAITFNGVSGESGFQAYASGNTVSVAYMGVGSIDNPGKIATLTFDGVSEGEGNIQFASSEVRGLTDDGNSQVILTHSTEVTGYINVDGTAPSVDSVVITNDTVAATDDYVKNTDTVTVTASGTDLPAVSWAAGVDATGVTADLSGFGGGGSVAPTTFNYNSGTRQWTATWTLTASDTTPDDGTVTVTVDATDIVNNGPTQGADTIIADNTKPTITNIVCVKTTDAGGIDMANLDNAYAKDGDTLSLTASVTDPAAGAESVKSGVPDVASIKANLTNINGNSADGADSYTDPNASWTITVTNSVEGAHLIVVTATDLVGNSDTGTATSAITIDKTAPGAVSSFKATADGSLEFSFSGTWGTDYYGIRFSRKSASQISGSIGYPRYDAGSYPIADGYESGKACNHDDYYATSPTGGSATHIDKTYTSAPGNPVTYEETTAGQDVYYYQSYVYDKAGNFSAADTANHNDRDSATGYFLGDFDNDGDIDFSGDLTPFSNAFGTDYNHGSWSTFDDCDIGPTGATQRRGNDNRFGLPKTDGVVDFEDLMIFAMNFNNVPPAPMYQQPVFPTDTPLVSLSSEQRAVDANEIFSVSLKLSHNLKAKGAHLMLNYDPRYFEVVKVTEGSLGMTFFRAEDKESVVDINVAALGGDVPLADETIATLEFKAKGSSPNTTIYLSEIDVRGVRNEKADDKLVKLGKVGLNLSVGKPDVTKVFHNYPNPFNPETWIPFQLDKETDVSVKIYGLNGHLVKAIQLWQLPAGYYLNKDKAIHWDGRNDSGERVSSGIYFYQFKAGKVIKTSKMVILK
jgi:hypothetical protein